MSCGPRGSKISSEIGMVRKATHKMRKGWTEGWKWQLRREEEAEKTESIREWTVFRTGPVLTLSDTQ